VREESTANARRELSVSFTKLGDLCKEEGDLTGAREYYERAYEIDEALAAENGTVWAERDLSISCERLGNVCRGEGNLDAARKYYEQAYSIRRALLEKTKTLQAWQDTAISSSKLGVVCQLAGDLTGAKRYCEQAVEAYEAAAAIGMLPQLQRSLRDARERLEKLCRRMEGVAEQKQPETVAKRHMIRKKIRRDVAADDDDIIEE